MGKTLDDGRRGYADLMWRASKWLAMPVVSVVALKYTAAVVTRPAGEANSLAITAFGLIAALAAVCLSTSGPVGRDTTPAVLRLAGERLLHSSVLLLQVLFVMYARDSVLHETWVSGAAWLRVPVEWIARVLLSLVSSAAALTFYWAIDALNDELWMVWRVRIGIVTAAKENKPNPNPSPVATPAESVATALSPAAAAPSRPAGSP